MSGNDTVDLTLVLHRDEPSDNAIRVSETGDEARATWLPRSKVKARPTGQFVQARIGAPKLAVVIVTMPAWLAEDRGFA